MSLEFSRRKKTTQAGNHSAQAKGASASYRVLSPTFIANEDPTRTITLRQAYIRDVNNRFNALKTVIRQSIVDNDCFGLIDKPKSIQEIMALGYKEELAKLNAIPRESFRFLRDDQKVEEFMKWINTQQDKGVLEIVQRPGRQAKGISSWQNTYLRSSYQKGLSRARSDLIKSGVDIPSWEEIPGGVSGAFYQAQHADAAGLIFTRAYNELKGVTAAMDQQISRHLAAGLVEGVGPYEMARRINDRVDKIGINRARLIARTEVTQTFNTAIINEFASATRAIGETVFCQWWTARDDRVRLHHANRHGRVFSQARARELIGEPNCRCTLVPYIKSVHQKGGILKPGKGGVLPPKDATPIIKPPINLPEPLNIDTTLVSGIFPPTTPSAHKKAARAIRDSVADDLSTQLGDDYVITSESVNIGGGDEMQQFVLKTKKGKYVGNIRYDIDMATGNIYYDDIHFEKAFQKKGIASKSMNLLDYTSSSISRKLGEGAIASLDAEEAGRYVWARLGFNITDPKDLAKIHEFAKAKGIVVRKRDDLLKLKKYFDAEDAGLPHTFGMDKALEAPKYYRDRMRIRAPKPPKATLTPAEQRVELVQERAALPRKSFRPEVREQITTLNSKIAKTYVDEGDLAKYNKLKADIMRDITNPDNGVKMTPAMKKKVLKAVEWMPYDVLEQLRSDGYRLIIRNKVKYGYYSKASGQTKGFRAYFQNNSKTAVVAKDDTFDVIAHELAHAVDDMFSGNYSTGGQWHHGPGKFVTKSDAQEFREWFKTHVNKGGYSKGTYSNGDGRFWKDNWLNDYEGRIYEAAGMRMGVEWWTMNLQRYSRYRVKLQEWPAKYAKNKAELARLKAKRAKLKARNSEIPGYMDSKIASYESKLELSGEDWAAGVSRWGMAKRRYPSLAKFIEEKFSGEFITL